jgi:4-(2-carboxyphenyl)-2-oxobut-3-enoate aldolase
VPDEHVKTTVEHVARYKQILGEVEQRFGVRASKDSLTKV